MPVHGTFNQPAPHGIGVDVVDLFPDFGGRPEIVIVPAAALPEALCLTAVGLAVEHPAGELRRFALNEQEGPLRHRLLERRENRADVIVRIARMDQQMNMLGHDDPRPQVQKMPLAGERDGVDHPFPRAVAVEERPTLETGEGEVVGMADDIVPLTCLSNG